MFFRNCGLGKTWLYKCLKSLVWEDPSIGNTVNGPKNWFNLNGSTFTILIDHCKGNYWKRSLLVTCKVLRLFVNTPTADDKYSLLSRDNLMQQFRWIYLEIKKLFPSFFVHFWNLQKILNIFKKRYPHILYISESTDAEIGC